MKLIMESWEKFINESKDVFKAEKLDGKAKGKVIYRVRHIPSGYTIPVQYYVSSSKNVKALVKFLNQEFAGMDEINKDNVDQLVDRIIDSEYSNPNYNYKKSTQGEQP
tara:strand:+ start:64 stop:387 length:324 start_codon:yes stop_codon:yes gene_type:complete